MAISLSIQRGWPAEPNWPQPMAAKLPVGSQNASSSCGDSVYPHRHHAHEQVAP